MTSPFKTTHCFLLHRKSVIHSSKSVSILYVFILSSNLWWETVSIALVKSVYMTPTCPPESNCVVQSSIIFKSCRIVDLPLLVDIFFIAMVIQLFMALNGLYCADMLLTSWTLTRTELIERPVKLCTFLKVFLSKSKNCDFLRFLSHCTHFLEHWFSWTLFQVGLCWIWVDTIWPNTHRLFDPLQQISSEY